MTDSLSQHCPNCEAQAAEIEKLREALKRIEQRCETFAHINLVGRSADAKEGGTLRNVLQDARAALGETK